MMLKLLVYGYALVFCAFGAAALFFPKSFALLLPFGVSNPSGLIEIQAFYGGLDIALGGFTLFLLRKSKFVPLAFLFMAVICSALAFSRGTGLIWQGYWDSFHLGALVFEALGALVFSWWYWGHLRREPL